MTHPIEQKEPTQQHAYLLVAQSRTTGRHHHDVYSACRYLNSKSDAQLMEDGATEASLYSAYTHEDVLIGSASAFQG